MEYVFETKHDFKKDRVLTVGQLDSLPVREEIIRCRDCKRMDEIQLETNQPCSTDPNGFCAWAVRK